MKVSKLSSFTMNPRDGHLEATYSIFVYIKKHLRSKIGFDPSYVKLDENTFIDVNQDDFYGDTKEKIPLIKPEPR